MTKFNLPFPYIVDHIPKDIPIPNNNNKPFQKRPQFKLDWEFITIHDTGNEKSTAKNERGWLTNPSNTSSTGWHIVVDEKEAIEAIPLNEVAWHAGDGANGTGNRKSIGIELCESGNRQKTLNNAVLLVVALLKSKNKSIEVVKQHFDWSKKSCPRLLRANNNAGWKKFINDINKERDTMTNIPQWKLDIMEQSLKEGLITSSDHHPDDKTDKWFVLAVMLNLLKITRRQ